jgi:hypothetical protein
MLKLRAGPATYLAVQSVASPDPVIPSLMRRLVCLAFLLLLAALLASVLAVSCVLRLTDAEAGTPLLPAARCD